MGEAGFTVPCGLTEAAGERLLPPPVVLVLATGMTPAVTLLSELLLVLVLLERLELVGLAPPLADTDSGVLPLGLPLPTPPLPLPLLLLLELWCVPPTTPPTIAPMIRMMTMTIAVTPHLVRYHGPFAPAGLAPFSSCPSLRVRATAPGL